MTELSEVARILSRITSPSERTLAFSALLGREAGIDEGLIVVGGSAIEIYSQGAYVSGDIDIIGERKKLEGVLRDWGFRKDSRIWWSEAWKITIDIVRSRGYTGRPSLLRTIESPFGRVRIAAVEDLIIGRLASTKHWRLPGDLNQAVILVIAYDRTLDWDYIESRAEREDVADLLPELRKRATLALGESKT